MARQSCGPRRSLIPALLGLAVVALLAAGCSSSPASQSGGPSANSSSSTPGQNIAADKALAQQASLKLSDFPAGWTAQPQSNGPSTPTINKNLASCLHTTVAFLDENTPAEVQSPNFTDSNGDQVSSDIDYEATSTKLLQDFSVLEEPQFPGCVETAFNAFLNYMTQHPTSPSDTLPQGFSFGKSTVAQLSFPPEGNQSIAYEVTLPVSAASGFGLDLYMDLVAARKGRAGAILTFFGVGQPLNINLEEQLSALTVSRLVDT